MARDYFGNEINIGDTVAFMQTGYRSMMTGIVEKITNSTLIIQHEKTNRGKTSTKQDSSQVFVKPVKD